MATIYSTIGSNTKLAAFLICLPTNTFFGRALLSFLVHLTMAKRLQTMGLEKYKNGFGPSWSRIKSPLLKN
jgi:hypothetical protein